MYSENPDSKYFRHPVHVHFFDRLWKILQEYWLGEVAKLGDPAMQNGRRNLSVDYIYEHGGWSESQKAELNELRYTLAAFSSKIKPARNRLLSHKDAETIASGVTVGSFDEGNDEAYFESLQKYASLAHQYTIGSPYCCDDLTRNDVEIFTTTFIRGLLFDDAKL